MSSKRTFRRLLDIIENAEAILRYTDGMDLNAFEENRMAYDAVERCLERITEASVKLGETASALMPDQPWPKIRALGNILRHEYDDIREDRLFEVITKDVPGLLDSVRRALGSMDESGH